VRHKFARRRRDRSATVGSVGIDPGRVRHDDPGWRLARFAGTILVVCPRCGGRAVVVPKPGLPELRYYTELLYRPRRLACAGCGAVAEWEAEVRGAALVAVSLGGTEDPFFRRPLWLQTSCAGRVLWAYNIDHVTELAAYVGAQLRERGGMRPTMSMFARLPRWMKSATNRADVLAGLKKLEALAERATPADRSDAARERGDRPRPYRGLYFRGGAY
jgi:hypothetical protein